MIYPTFMSQTHGVWVYDKNMGRFDNSFYLAYNLNA